MKEVSTNHLFIRLITFRCTYGARTCVNDKYLPICSSIFLLIGQLIVLSSSPINGEGTVQNIAILYKTALSFSM